MVRAFLADPLPLTQKAADCIFAPRKAARAR